MQPITEKGEVKKTIISAGSGDSPIPNQDVIVNYIGKLENGTEFDRGDQFKFKLGVGNVIKGWDVGVATMKRGEQCDLWICSDYAYGDKGSPPKIPPKSNLIFTVTLLDFAEKFKNKYDLTDEENLAEGKAYKEKGNKQFTDKVYTLAEYYYMQGSDYLSNIPEKALTDDIKTLKLQLMTNTCVVMNKQGKYAKAINQATDVLKLYPKNTKALYARGVAYQESKQYEEAKADMKELAELMPSDADIKYRLSVICEAIKQRDQKEKQMYKNMFSGK